MPRSSFWYSAASLSTIAPPIEQPSTTGRSSASACHTSRVRLRYSFVVSRYFFSHQPDGGVDRPWYGRSNAMTRKRFVTSASFSRCRYWRLSAPAVCRHSNGTPCPASSKKIAIVQLVVAKLEVAADDRFEIHAAPTSRMTFITRCSARACCMATSESPSSTKPGTRISIAKTS